MDIERMFLNTFSIEKKPLDICELIEAAIVVGAKKHPAEFEKRKKRIFNMLMYPGLQDIDDDDEISTLDDDDDEDDEISTLDDDDDDNDDSVGDEVDVTSVQEPQKEEPANVKKIKIVIKKAVQVAPPKKHNNCNVVTETTETELKPRLETDNLVQQLDDADKQGTPQSHNTTTMASRKRMLLKNESTKSVQAAPPRARLLSDFSFEKQLDGDKQRQKQSHKGFKKMENDHDAEKKKEEGAQQTPTQRKRKECTTGLMKTNVATKPVQEKELVSDCSPQKYSSITRPMQKETQSITDRTKKFESSKRKFEGRLAEQREAKRRTVMVDFRDMPKPANDSCAPRRRCWNWKRF